VSVCVFPYRYNVEEGIYMGESPGDGFHSMDG